MSELRLVHVHGGEPGLRRERRGPRFVYVDDTTGEAVSDADTLRRIEGLRIPPAWTDVWISDRRDPQLQATGLDAPGRRQSVSHPTWRSVSTRW